MSGGNSISCFIPHSTGLQTLATIRNCKYTSALRNLNLPARTIPLIGIVFLAKEPEGDRLDCLTQLPHEPRPHYRTRVWIQERFALRRKRWELTNLHTIQKQGRWSKLILAINVQRGNRIIVIETFFATPFSDLFRLKSTSNFCALDRSTNATFAECKQLKDEKIHDRITHFFTITVVSLVLRTATSTVGNP